MAETVNYTCTVRAPSHTWRIGPSISITVNLDTTESINGPYNVMVVAVEDNNFITSTLSVISFPELNGTVLLCKDASALPGQGEVQETTARVHGKRYIMIDAWNHDYNLSLYYYMKALLQPQQKWIYWVGMGLLYLLILVSHWLPVNVSRLTEFDHLRENLVGQEELGLGQLSYQLLIEANL